jgi:NAD(P)-dependent dehydrogenase (short-subunit alcohol dehydrogenase family)
LPLAMHIHMPNSKRPSPSLSTIPYEDRYYAPFWFGVFIPFSIVYSLTAQLTLRLLGKTPRIEPIPMYSSTAPPTATTNEASPTSSSLTPRIAIVTGSNTGIGCATAQGLALAGCHVILACRSRDRAEQAVRSIQQALSQQQQQSSHTTGQALFVHPLDLNSDASTREFVTVVTQRYPRIDILINNAGMNTSFRLKSNVNDTNDSEVDRDGLFQTNFVGHYLLTSLLLPHMTGPNARIVNLASVMHHFCGGSQIVSTNTWQHCIEYQESALHSTYSLSKLAALLFTRELNVRYGDRIQAIAVNPGAV